MNKIFTGGPIDGSQFNADLDAVSGAQLVAINYDLGIYRWRPIDAEGALLLPPDRVFGTNVEIGAACEIAADDHIRADIERTLAA